MANHKSALKRARQSESRRLRNRISKTKVKNAVKAVRLTISESSDNATDVLKKAMSALSKAATKGALHRRNASRRIARLSKQLNEATKNKAA